MTFQPAPIGIHDTDSATCNQLRAALTSNRSIGTAVGILMGRYDMTSEGAFEYLVRVSQSTNVKLSRIAEQLVDEANERHDRLA